MTGQMSGQGAPHESSQAAPTFKRTCGSCTLCCKVYGIAATESPVGSWCKHCEPGKGCGIWETRPDFCRQFFCNWIMLDWLGEEWRPDVCKIVFTFDPTSGYLMFQVDPGSPDAWKKEPYYSQIKTWATEGLPRARGTLVFVNKAATLVLPDGDQQLGELGPQDRINIGPGGDGTIKVEVKRGPKAS